MQQIKFDKKGNLAAILSDDGRLKVWDRASGFLVNDISEPEILEDRISCFVFSPSSAEIIIAGESGHVFVYDLLSNSIKQKKLISSQNLISCLEVSDNFQIFCGTKFGDFLVLEKDLGIFKKTNVCNSKISVLKINLKNTKIFIGARNSFVYDLVSYSPIFSLPVFYSTSPIDAAWMHDKLFVIPEVEAVSMMFDFSQRTATSASILTGISVKNVSISQKFMAFTTKKHAFLALNSPKTTSVNYHPQVCGGDDILATFCHDKSIYLVRNSFISPRFETFDEEIVDCTQNEPKTLIFEKPSEKVDNIETVMITEKVIFGAQSSQLPQTHTISASGSEFLESGRKSSDFSQKIREINKISDFYDFSENSENLSIFLVQAILSKDKEMLKKILFSTPKNLIDKIVKNLPVKIILNFLQEIIYYLKMSQKNSKNIFIWLKALIINHASFIQSSIDCQALLKDIYSLISGNVINFSEMNRLQGRLDLLLKRNNSIGSVDLEAEIEFNEDFEGSLEDNEEYEETSEETSL